MYLPRVLLVEHDAIVRQRVVELLADEGYPHRAISEVDDAIGELQRGDFDVLLVDPDDGEQAGIALMEAVRARFPSIEIIVLAKRPSIELTARALRLGSYDLILSPVELPAVLRQTMRRVAETVRLARQNLLLLRELQTTSDGLAKLDREVRALTEQILELHAETKSRGLTLDLSVVYELGLLALSRFAGGREVILLNYDATAGVVRGEKTSNTARRLVDRLEIVVGNAETARLDAIDDRHAVASLLRDYFADDHLQVYPLLHGHEALGLIVVLSAAGIPRSTHDASLLRQFAEWLALLFSESRMYKSLLELSAVDGLTGLFNHRFFQDRLSAEIARAQRHSHPVSLLFCDLDNFKSYNDRYGHAAGDLLLSEVGHLLRSGPHRAEALIAFRDSDVAARYGGEEFVVILPETNAAGALVKADRLREAVQRVATRIADGNNGEPVTISIGVAELPRDGSNKNELIDAADRAMYAAKRLGKNRVVDVATLTPTSIEHSRAGE
jgi:diguanylate cyclase (GGDEF)-like protein